MTLHELDEFLLGEKRPLREIFFSLSQDKLKEIIGLLKKVKRPKSSCTYNNAIWQYNCYMLFLDRAEQVLRGQWL